MRLISVNGLDHRDFSRRSLYHKSAIRLLLRSNTSRHVRIVRDHRDDERRPYIEVIGVILVFPFRINARERETGDGIPRKTDPR